MRPSLGLILALIALLVLSIAAASLRWLAPHAHMPAQWLVWFAITVLVILAAADAWALYRAPRPTLTRTLPGTLALGREAKVILTLTSHGAHPQRLLVWDHVPSALGPNDLPIRTTLPPGHIVELSYRLCPSTRGRYVFEVCALQLTSQWRLWHQVSRVALHSDVKVLPDFARLHGAQMQAIERWLPDLGVHPKPRRGQGLEFRQLRDYRDGDSLRQIDWKATARKHRLVSRDYQDEQDQQLLLMLDCGRRLRSQDGRLAHFDHALNASLLLGYVALRQGDAVGISTFATGQPFYLRPGKGQTQLTHLLDHLYAVQPGEQPADFAAAVQQVLIHQRRRALVIILTNLREEDGEELTAALTLLRRSHQVLVVSLREPVLTQIRETASCDLDQALSYCGTVSYQQAADALHKRLQAQGLTTIDCEPEQLGPDMVSAYMRLKRAASL